MLDILNNKSTEAQIASFITALKMKGYTENEIFWFVKSLRDKMVRINPFSKRGEMVFDTCGTGGSRFRRFNVSTVVAFIVSSFGIKVAKHGNRSASTFTGSADVLEKMGVNINLKPHLVEEAIKRIGFGFLFAPLYHSSLKYAAGVRKQLGFRSIFNILGPLCNPAGANMHLLGISDLSLGSLIAGVLKRLKMKRAMVVWGKPGLDEVSVCGDTICWLVERKKVKKMRLQVSHFGKKKLSIKNIRGGDVSLNAEIVEDVLKGKKMPEREIVEVNASCCLWLAGKVKDFKEGVEVVSCLLDKKKAWDKFREYRDYTQEYAK